MSRHYLFITSLAVASVLSGCGSASVRYATPVQERYEQQALLRPRAAKTFAVTSANPGFPTDRVAVEGMQRVDMTAADLVITVDFKGTSVAPGDLKSAYVCVSGPTLGADGKSIDGSMGKYYQPLGFNEPIVQAPLHLVVLHWMDCTQVDTGSYQVQGGGKMLSQGDLTAQTSFRVGKPLDRTASFREMMTVASAGVAVGNDARVQGPADAAATTASNYLQDAFGDYKYIGSRGYLVKSKVELAMKQMASDPNSPARKALIQKVDEAVKARTSDPASVLAKLQEHLTANYASGPRAIGIEIAQVEGNPAVQEATAKITALIAMPTVQRQVEVDGIIKLLSQGRESLRPEDVRACAACHYNEAIVHYLIGDFVAAQRSLQRARLENQKETDGMFGSTGKQLGQKIERLAVSAADRARRAAANL